MGTSFDSFFRPERRECSIGMPPSLTSVQFSSYDVVCLSLVELVGLMTKEFLSQKDDPQDAPSCIPMEPEAGILPRVDSSVTVSDTGNTSISWNPKPA